MSYNSSGVFENLLTMLESMKFVFLETTDVSNNTHTSRGQNQCSSLRHYLPSLTPDRVRGQPFNPKLTELSG